MRIVAGKLRHRIIDMTNLDTTRETQDKVRGAIYNMIGPYFDGGVALDLFAGSGAMGIEAYSRGINKIYLNDLNNEALNVCKKNCKSLGINDVVFTNMDYQGFLDNNKVLFDLIILDPPYKMDNTEDILKACYDSVNDKGIVVFEMKLESFEPKSYKNLYYVKTKPYGIKKVVIYRRNNNE